MKICPRCNASNNPTDIICQNCGNQLDSFESPEVDNMQYQNMLKTNGLAVASLVVSIIGLICSCCCGLGLIASIPALIMGVISKMQISNLSRNEKGDGLAMAGIIISVIGIMAAITIIVFIFFTGSGEEFLTKFQEGFNEGLQEEMQNQY
jgi:uncharacterized membrane protein YvbJ